MPSSMRSTIQRRDKREFYKAVSGKRFIAKQAGKNYRLGVTWMFPVAYAGETMPYWDAWYDRRMTANEIGNQVAADFRAEIARREAVRAENRRIFELWDEAGQVGPRPVRTAHLTTVPPAGLPATQMPALPQVAPAPLPQVAPVPPPLPGFQELPPLIY